MSPAPAIDALSAGQKRNLLSELLEKRARVRAAGRQKVCPVSFSQRRLWFLDQLVPGTPFYNVDFAVPLPQELDLDEDAFERTFSELVRRHESLRTVFEAVDGEPMQVIRTPARVQIERLDLRHLPEAEQQAEALRIIRAQAARPFDLANGPLMRTSLIHRSAGYIMVLALHHIICDGWSMGVFWREFLAIYTAYRAGLPSPLPEPGLQYADFAAWQRRWLQGAVLEEHLLYWKRKLENLPALNLPLDRPRPPAQTFRGASRPIHIPKALTESMQTIAEREGATLFMILLTVFKVLLCRYAGQEDIAVGSYIANRNRAEVEEIIGFFVNTLVMRTDLTGNPPFLEAMARVKETALGAYAHQDMPFETLVEALQPERDLARNPLFQVIFQVFKAPTVDYDSAGSEENALQVDKQTSTFDLGFNLWVIGDELSGAIDYSTDLFDAETIERMVAHYFNLLHAIVEDPSRNILDLPILSEEESRRAILEWNATEAAEETCSVPEMFRAQVERKPDEVALIGDGVRITFAELGARVGQFARELRSCGVGPDRTVAICMERSLDAVVAMLAAFETGAAYVPIDPGFPAERREFIARDAGICGVIGASGFEPAPQWAAPQNGLAYVIYTSGSTGKPKGVAVEHRPILNRLWWMWRRYPFEAHEVACLKTSLTFVDSIWEVLGPLLRGVPVVVVSEHTSRDPRALLQLLAAHRVTRLWLVPSLLREMVTTLEEDSDLCRDLSALRFWVSSGEALSPELAGRFAQLLPSATLYNLYGTSEVWDATWHDPRRDRVWPGRSIIGRPIDGVQAWVLDTRNRPAPIGIAGELVIGGAGLAREYQNLPELTNERFPPHPFRPQNRVYRTGDAARYLPDGQIEFLGRLDRQVKIRGFRVEPREIEDALASHPAVREAAVIAVEAPTASELAAYVAGRADQTVTISELQDHLQRRLPSHMLPATITFLEEIPKTTSGKLNRTALPTHGRMEAARQRPFVAPSTPAEMLAVDLYKAVLGLEEVSADAHFFRELGGHSLLATRIASRVRNLLGIDLPLQTIFECPTPSLLARALEKNGGQ
jgi:amino acid adenylation domain-containing protein